MNWVKIKKDYYEGMALNDIAQKHGISYNSLRATASKKGWPQERKAQDAEITQKLTQKRIEKYELMAETEIELKLIEKETGFALLDRIGRALKKKTLTPYQIESLSKTYNNLFTRLYKAFNISDVIELKHSVEHQHSILFEVVEEPEKEIPNAITGESPSETAQIH